MITSCREPIQLHRSKYRRFNYLFPILFIGFYLCTYDAIGHAEPSQKTESATANDPNAALHTNTPTVTQDKRPADQAVPPADPSVSLPGTHADQLAIAAQRDLVKLMSEGPCPCDPSRTLLMCIQKQDCPAATSLAEYGVELYKAGLGSDQVTEAVINKFIQDFSPPVEFNLSKTPWKGAENAPITIVEFADFECPHCAMMAVIMSEIVKERSPSVKLYFKQFPLPFHKLAPLASQATLAAHRQGEFWLMHDLIFSQQEKLSEELFIQFAEQLGLNLMVFRADYADEALIKEVEADRDEGVKAGLEGTPTLFFNGKIYRGQATKEAILAHIDQLIKEAQSPSKAQ